MMSWITSIYECRLCMVLTRSNLIPACIICTHCKQSAVDCWSVAAVTNKSKVPCVLKLEPSPLQLPTLHSNSSPALHVDIQFSVKCAFKIYSICPQAQLIVCIHTHLCNAVPLVWGSFRLAPIRECTCRTVWGEPK